MEISRTIASESRDEFLMLLVTQLRNQDPFSPMKQEDMLSQLAQFSTLEAIEKLNNNFEQFLASQEESQKTQNLARAAELIGRDVIYERDPLPATDGTETPIESTLFNGKIESVLLSDDRVRLQVDGVLISIDDIREITGKTTE